MTIFGVMREIDKKLPFGFLLDFIRKTELENRSNSAIIKENFIEVTSDESLPD